MNLSKREKTKYILFFIILVVIALTIRSYMVVDDSMTPAYKNGSKVITMKLPEILIPHDSVVIIKNTKRSLINDKTLIKRLVGKSGDTISIKDGKLIVNNKVIDKIDNVDKKEFIIPKNHIYVIGDNTSYSIDSRDFGSVRSSSIKGVVIFPLQGRDK